MYSTKEERRIRDIACEAHDALESLMFVGKVTPSEIQKTIASVNKRINALSEYVEEENEQSHL